MLYSFPFWCGANRGNRLFSKAMSKYLRFECPLPVPAGICGHLPITQFFTIGKKILVNQFFFCAPVFSACLRDNWTFRSFLLTHFSSKPVTVFFKCTNRNNFWFCCKFSAVFNIESLEAWNSEVSQEQSTRHRIIKKFNAVSLRYLLK